LLSLLGDRLVLRPDATEGKTDAINAEEVFSAVITAVGPATCLQVGQRVLCPSGAGHAAVLGGEAVVIVREGDVLGLLK
jgi:co-chaperonin GroES (HSP10)